MPIIPMDPELIQKSIEGFEDELSPENTALEAFYRQFQCPNCGGKMHKEFFLPHAFADPGTMNPRALLRCFSCELLFDPHRGLVIEMGKELLPKVGVDRWEHLKHPVSSPESGQE